MNFDSIVAFGDSHVAGAELDGPQSTDVKDQAFPAILGKRWNVPVYNYSWSGGSNDRSLRLLPEKLLQHPNSLVIFFYTDFSRNEYVTPDLDDTLATDDTGYSPLGVCWDHDCIAATTRNLSNSYYKNFYHDTLHYNNYREYNTILTVQLFCEKYARDHVQIFGFPRCLNAHTENQSILLKEIDFDKILKFPGNTWSDEGWNMGHGHLLEWVKKENIPFGAFHMLHEGHKKLADLIERHINDFQSNQRTQS